LTKHDLVDQLTRKSGLKRRDVLYIVENFLDLILKGLDKGEKVELRGFGTFARVERKKREVFSPIANRNLEVPARSVLTFKASKSTGKVLK
jgi:nucleoid DNA-binding protein